MNVNDSLPAVELLVNRFKGFIAEVFVLEARHQTDAVRLQLIHRILDFAKTALSVGEGNRGEEAESSAMVGDHLCSVLVAIARKSARVLDAAQPDARLNERDDGGRNPILVHLLDGHLGAPWRRPPALTLRQDRFKMARRYEVMVEVYPAGGTKPATSLACCGADCRPHCTSQETPASEMSGANASPIGRSDK